MKSSVILIFSLFAISLPLSGQGNFIIEYQNNIEHAIEQSIRVIDMKLKEEEKDTIISFQKEILRNVNDQLIVNEIEELAYLLDLNKGIEKIEKPTYILVNFSAPTLIKESIGTQCENIQTMILKNIVENWKQVLLFKGKLVEVQHATGNTPFQKMLNENISQTLDQIEALKIKTNIFKVEQTVDFQNDNERLFYLEKIKESSQSFVELSQHLELINNSIQGKINSYLNNLTMVRS